MNTNTGELRMLNDEHFKNELKNQIGDWVPIDMNDATDKQKEEMQVDKHDVRSKLGKLFSGNRRQRREQERAFNKSLKRKSIKP